MRYFTSVEGVSNVLRRADNHLASAGMRAFIDEIRMQLFVVEKFA